VHYDYDTEGVNANAADIGGVTKDFLGTFAKKAAEELFEIGDRKGFLLPYKEKNTKKDLSKFETLGKIMLKCIIEDVAVNVNFSPIIFKYLVSDLPITLKQICKEYRDFYEDQSKAVDNVLSFSNDNDLEYMFFELENSEIKYTINNKQVLLLEMMHKALIEDRKDQLEAIKRGFTSIDDIQMEGCLKNLSHVDLMRLICGQANISAEDVIKLLKYEKQVSPDTKEWLQQCLKEWDDQNRRKFLRFVTAMETITARTTAINIIHTDQGLKAATCFNRLYLPNYPDFETLKQKLEWALSVQDIAGMED